MATSEFAWIYLLIFLIIPLARIIPRMIRKRKMMANYDQPESFTEERFEQTTENIVQKPTPEPKHQTKDMQVLGELNLGTRSFEGIQKHTNIDSDELNSILADLEKRGLLYVQQKSGLFGTKVELYATDKGYKEYYS